MTLKTNKLINIYFMIIYMHLMYKNSYNYLIFIKYVNYLYT